MQTIGTNPRARAESVEAWMREMESAGHLPAEQEIEQLQHQQLPAYTTVDKNQIQSLPQQYMQSCCAFQKLDAMNKGTSTQYELLEKSPQFRFISWVVLARTPDQTISEQERLTCPMVWCRTKFQSNEYVQLVNHLSGCAHLGAAEYYCPYHSRNELFMEPQLPPKPRHSKKQFLKNAFESIVKLGFPKHRRSRGPGRGGGGNGGTRLGGRRSEMLHSPGGRAAAAGGSGASARGEGPLSDSATFPVEKRRRVAEHPNLAELGCSEEMGDALAAELIELDGQAIVAAAAGGGRGVVGGADPQIRSSSSRRRGAAAAGDEGMPSEASIAKRRSRAAELPGAVYNLFEMEGQLPSEFIYDRAELADKRFSYLSHSSAEDFSTKSSDQSPVSPVSPQMWYNTRDFDSPISPSDSNLSDPWANLHNSHEQPQQQLLVHQQQPPHHHQHQRQQQQQLHQNIHSVQHHQQQLHGQYSQPPALQSSDGSQPSQLHETSTSSSQAHRALSHGDQRLQQAQRGDPGSSSLDIPLSNLHAEWQHFGSSKSPRLVPSIRVDTSCSSGKSVSDGDDSPNINNSSSRRDNNFINSRHKRSRQYNSNSNSNSSSNSNSPDSVGSSSSAFSAASASLRLGHNSNVLAEQQQRLGATAAAPSSSTVPITTTPTTATIPTIPIPIPSPLQIEAESRDPKNLVQELRGLFNTLFKLTVAKIHQSPPSQARTAILRSHSSAANVFDCGFKGLHCLLSGQVPQDFWQVFGISLLAYACALATAEADLTKRFPTIYTDLLNWSQAIANDGDKRGYVLLVQLLWSPSQNCFEPVATHQHEDLDLWPSLSSINSISSHHNVVAALPPPSSSSTVNPSHDPAFDTLDQAQLAGFSSSSMVEASSWISPMAAAAAAAATAAAQQDNSDINMLHQSDHEILLPTLNNGVVAQLCKQFLDRYEYLSADATTSSAFGPLGLDAFGTPTMSAAHNMYAIRNNILDPLALIPGLEGFRPVVNNTSMLLESMPNISLRHLELMLLQEGKSSSKSPSLYNRFAEAVRRLVEQTAASMGAPMNRASYHATDIENVMALHQDLLMQAHAEPEQPQQQQPSAVQVGKAPAFSPVVSEAESSDTRPFSWADSDVSGESPSTRPSSIFIGGNHSGDVFFSQSSSDPTLISFFEDHPTGTPSHPSSTRSTASPYQRPPTSAPSIGTTPGPSTASSTTTPPSATPINTSNPRSTPPSTGPGGSASDSAEGTMTCKICGKVLAGKAVWLPSNMKRHMRELHTPAAKRLVCDVPGCGRAFLRNHNLAHHRKTVHGRGS